MTVLMTPVKGILHSVNKIQYIANFHKYTVDKWVPSTIPVVYIMYLCSLGLAKWKTQSISFTQNIRCEIEVSSRLKQY